MLSSSVKLLLLMLRQGACSRADLAKTMHLSRPAVSALVDGLIRQRILRESGCGVSNGGKPPIILTLEPQRFSSIGIDIGHESLLRGTLCDAAGNLLVSREIPHDNSCDGILSRTAELAEELKKSANAPIAGIGVAIAGQVDHASNEVVYCANFPLTGRNFAQRLSLEVSMPVILDNRARTAAQWEYYFGAARKTEDFIFISAERGIGTAIYQNGKLLQGRSGTAGEIRTLCVPSPDRTSLLPIEQAMSEKFLLELAGGNFNAIELIDAWNSGNPDARNAIAYLLDCAGYVITLLTMLLDPSEIVLGGRFRDLGIPSAAELEKQLRIEPRRALTIRLSASGRIGAALGAALNVTIRNISRTL